MTWCTFLGLATWWLLPLGAIALLSDLNRYALASECMGRGSGRITV